jgi:hypothetical protein
MPVIPGSEHSPVVRFDFVQNSWRLDAASRAVRPTTDAATEPRRCAPSALSGRILLRCGAAPARATTLALRCSRTRVISRQPAPVRRRTTTAAAGVKAPSSLRWSGGGSGLPDGPRPLELSGPGLGESTSAAPPGPARQKRPIAGPCSFRPAGSTSERRPKAPDDMAADETEMEVLDTAGSYNQRRRSGRANIARPRRLRARAMLRAGSVEGMSTDERDNVSFCRAGSQSDLARRVDVLDGPMHGMRTNRNIVVPVRPLIRSGGRQGLPCRLQVNRPASDFPSDFAVRRRWPSRSATRCRVRTVSLTRLVRVPPRSC